MTSPSVVAIASVPALPAALIPSKQNVARHLTLGASRATRVHLYSFQQLTRNFTITSRWKRVQASVLVTI